MNATCGKNQCVTGKPPTISQNGSKNHKEGFQRNLATRGIVSFSPETADKT